MRLRVAAAVCRPRRTDGRGRRDRFVRAAAAAAAALRPFTQPTYAHKVPSPPTCSVSSRRQGGAGPPVQSHLREVDAASTGVADRSARRQGRDAEVMYAIVGSAARTSRQRNGAARILRNPQTSTAGGAGRGACAGHRVGAGNVHGNEESGADAALRVLRDLADRTDCAARKIRDNVVTVLVPIQNPDGRWLNYRRNSYGFDMNRDWFARTQPETDGKLS